MINKEDSLTGGVSRWTVAFCILAALIFGTLPGCRAKQPAGIQSGDKAREVNRIVISDISQEASKKIKQWQPLADYLASRLADRSGGQVRVAPDMATLVKWMAAGEVHLYMDTFYPAMRISKGCGAEPLLLRRKGKPENYAVFFARADRNYSKPADLLGKIIALEEPESTSGFMLPVAHLLKEKLKPVAKSDPEAGVFPNEVGYVYSYDDDNTVQWVISGRVEAGAVDFQTFEEFARENPDSLVSLGRTEEVIRDQLVLFGPRLDAGLRDSLKSLLIGMDENPEGKGVLDQVKTKRFDEISPRDEAALAKAQALYDLVEGK